MPRRSTAITLSSNTGLDLTPIGTAGPCHGSWTNEVSPPSMIPKKTCAGWEAESSGFLTETEGLVKYRISNPAPCQLELVFIYWNNPFVWQGGSDGTKVIQYSVTTTDVAPV
jgi:hypothetical protein